MLYVAKVDPPFHLLSTTIEDTLYDCDADDVVVVLGLNMILAWIPFLITSMQ